jgi:hypothetical protein
MLPTHTPHTHTHTHTNVFHLYVSIVLFFSRNDFVHLAIFYVMYKIKKFGIRVEFESTLNKNKQFG